MNGSLSAYRAIDLTDERGLLAGQMLAKLGMDVIQVEPPAGSSARAMAPFDGQGNSFYWSAYAAGKRGITLDVEQGRGKELLLDLVARADFVLDSADPGRLDALGIGPKQLMERNPALIHVSITPFGSTGPKRDYADAELVLWAASGPLYANRDASGLPLRISVPQAYLHGAADAAAGVLIAHFARLKTGRGQHVDVSVQQSVTQATLASHLAAAIGHENFTVLAGGPKAKPGPRTLDLSGSGARTRKSKWRVADGLIEMHLSMGPATGGSTNNLFAWMKEEDALAEELQDWDWKTVPDRILAEEISEDDLEFARTCVGQFVQSRTKADLMGEAVRRKIMLAPISSISDLLESPQLRARGFFARVDEGGQERVIPGAFAAPARGLFAQMLGAPTRGQHNDEVYGDLLGIEDVERASLRHKGVI